MACALAAHVELEIGASRAVERAYFDTFDNLLRGANLTLLWEEGRLHLTADGGRALAALEAPCVPTAVRAQELPPGGLRDRVAPVLGVRAATATACMRVRRQAIQVLDSERKTIARLGIEEASVLLDGGRCARLAPRLTLGAVRGYDKAMDRIRRVAEGKLGLMAAAQSLVHEAIVRAGGRPSGPPAGVDGVLDPGQRSDRAVAAILTQLVGAIEANLPGTLADLDSEFLHDLRVAVRRTRALQRELRGVFPQAELERFRAEFRWLQAITGPSRDLDVYLLEFDAFAGSLPPTRRSDLEPLRLLLSQHRHRARQRMARALRSQRTHTALADWNHLLAALPSLPDEGRPDAAQPIGELSGRRIASIYRRMVKMGSGIDDQTPSGALHDLRKQGKELRYLLEFFGALFPEGTVDPMLRTLKSLQDTLGRFQDREVQAEMVCSLSQETATQANGPAALMAMGLLVERLSAQQAQARAEFAQRFAPFADKGRRAAVQETFS